MIYEVELGKKIRELREKAGLTLDKTSKLVGVNAVHLSYIEKGLRVPSEDLITRIITALVKSDTEKDKIKKECLLLLAKIKAPEEIRDSLQIEKFTPQAGSMPVKFIERLKKDIKSHYDNDEFWKLIGIDKKVAEEILSNRLILPRKMVIDMANKLKQPVDKYLFLAGYIPEEFEMLAEKEEAIAKMIRALASLPPEEIDQVITAMQSVLKLVKKDNV